MTGLVLGGGGGKGAYQAGVLKVLYENDLLTDIGAISGVSIGSVNGVLYSLGKAELMKKVWDAIDLDMVLEINENTISENGIYFQRDKMSKMIDDHINLDEVSKSETELYACLSKIENEEYKAEYMKLNGKTPEEIKQIILATTALPVLFEPITIDGFMYRDGGIKDNEPIKPLYDLGIRRFIVIGLKYDKVFVPTGYPDAEFIVIYPSHDLGDLISGTLNFSSKAKEFKWRLGEKDAKRAIKTKFEKQEIYINLEKQLALNDYNELVSTMRPEAKSAELNTSINTNIDKFNEIAKKFDIF